MIPLTVLVVSFAIFRLAGLEIAYFADWQRALRAALGVQLALHDSRFADCRTLEPPTPSLPVTQPRRPPVPEG